MVTAGPSYALETHIERGRGGEGAWKWRVPSAPSRRGMSCWGERWPIVLAMRNGGFYVCWRRIRPPLVYGELDCRLVSLGVASADAVLPPTVPPVALRKWLFYAPRQG